MRFLSVFLLLAGFGIADTVTFRDGHTVNGSFLGGDSRSIRVAVGDRIDTYSLSDVTSISFGSAAQAAATPASRQSAPAPSTPAPSAAPSTPSLSTRSTPPAAESGATIPAGTEITIRMIDSVDSERDSVGQTFKASLDEPVLDNSGNTLVPRGSDVVVKLVDDKESGKIQGKTVLTLDIVSLTVNGRQVDIDTTAITQESGSRTARSGKIIGGTAALGAIIGAIAGGGKGAAIGAVSGAGAGTAVQVMTKGQRVNIPSETRLTFTLQQPLRL